MRRRYVVATVCAALLITGMFVYMFAMSRQAQVWEEDDTLLGPLPLETCDDGNADDGDGCSAECQLE